MDLAPSSPGSSGNVGRTQASAHHGEKTKAAGRDTKARKKLWVNVDLLQKESGFSETES